MKISAQFFEIQQKIVENGRGGWNSKMLSQFFVFVQQSKKIGWFLGEFWEKFKYQKLIFRSIRGCWL